MRPRLYGVHDDPNSQWEVWGNPNANVFHEFGEDAAIVAQGSASGSIGPAGLAGALSGALGGGGGSPPIHPAIVAQLAASGGMGPAAAARAAYAAHPVMQYAARTARETNAREMLLEPNKNSTTKIERFVFALNQTITALGTGQALSMRDTPDTNIRPQRVTANSPSPGFVTFSTIRVGNIDVLSGSIIDSFDFNANGQGQSLDMPTLKTATKLTVAGTYSGLVPSPLTGTGAYVFTVSFKGPATLSP
jgi:hypothetical protein